MCILTSWLLKKPVDLDLHCFQLSLCLLKEFMHGVSKVRAKMSSLSIICSLGQVKLSLDKYIMDIYLSLSKYKILLFAHPCLLG